MEQDKIVLLNNHDFEENSKKLKKVRNKQNHTYIYVLKTIILKGMISNSDDIIMTSPISQASN